MNYYLNVKPIHSSEDREKVLRYFIPYLNSIPVGLERENCIVKLSKITGFESDVIRGEINKESVSENKETIIPIEKSYRKIKPQNQGALENAERLMLYYMLHNREAVEFFIKSIDSFYNETYQTIANFIIEYENERQTDIEISLLLSDIESQGFDNTEELRNIATILSEDTSYPPFNYETIENCARTIKSEKDKKYEKTKLSDSLLGKTKDEQAELYNEKLKEKRKRLAQGAIERKKHG